MKRSRVHLKIYGRVQGVFFRNFALRESERLGVAVSPRNMPDGTVEIDAEGPREVLEELIEACKRGPPLAKVEKIEVEWENHGSATKGGV